MARIERGGEFGGVRPVLLERIIKQLVEREKALWPEVTINLASNGPVQMVAADEEYLAQIMRNLLSNAAKYSGAGSTVEVSLEDTEGEVLIRVRDNGRASPRTMPTACSGCTTARPSRRPRLPAPASGCSCVASWSRPWAAASGPSRGPRVARSSGSASRPTSTSSISPRRRHGPCLRSRADHRRTRIRRRAAGHARLEPGAGHRLTPLAAAFRSAEPGEMSECRRLVHDPQPAKRGCPLSDPADDLDDVVDVALGIRAARDRQPDEVHRGRRPCRPGAARTSRSRSRSPGCRPRGRARWRAPGRDTRAAERAAAARGRRGRPRGRRTA